MTAFQLGQLVGTLITLLIFMLVIGTLYYLIKRPNTFHQAWLNRWVIGASLGLFLLGLMGRASSNWQQDTSHVYPSADVKGFTSGCVESAKAKIAAATAEKICSCTIAEIQKTYTFGEFKKIGQEMQANKTMPPAIQASLTACAKQSV